MTERRQLLSTPEVAELLGKSLRTVHRLAESGELPAIKLGDSESSPYVFDLDDVERYLGATAQ